MKRQITAAIQAVLFVAAGLAGQAHASVAIIAGAAGSSSAGGKHAVDTLMTAGNDGFIQVGNFYRDGPELRVCVESVPNVSQLTERNKKCLARVRNDESVIPTASIVDLGPGLTLQEVLDREFGVGRTTFVGVGPRQRWQGEEQLIIFYRINRDTPKPAP